MKRGMGIAAVMLAAAAITLASLTACQRKQAEPALSPKVAPPAIKQAGVLRVAVDPTLPPFAGTADGQTVGLDVDVAAAVAERLGLKLHIVKTPWQDIPEAVAKRDVDVGLGGIPITEAVLADVSVAGSYATDGVGIFAVVSTGTAETTSVLSPDELSASIQDAPVACQQGSAAQWYLESQYWEGFAKTYETLREAFDALSAGEVRFVACDAFVGSYLGRDYDGIRFIGWLGDTAPLGALVSKDSPELEAKIREVLDTMAADGTLGAIRTKWVGELPEPRTAESETATGSP